MKTPALIFAALISMCTGTAMAACPDKSASSNGTEQTAGISEDGTHAPLETPKSATPDNKDSAQKDGATMPMATEEGGGNKNLATSQQDVEAQQQGKQNRCCASRRLQGLG